MRGEPGTAGRRGRAGIGLLERKHQLSELKRSLSSARRGHGAAIVFAGERGSGKTSLLAEARTLASRGRMGTLPALCSPEEGGFPFGVLRQLLDRAGARSKDGDVAVALGEAAERGEGEGGLADLELLHRAFHRIAERRPTLITVDDLDACDARSLAFLGYLARRIEGLPIVLACAATVGDGSAAIESLLSTPGLLFFRLGDLSEGGAAGLIAGRTGADPDPAFSAACHRATGGNPRLVAELADAAVAAGIDPRADAATRVGELAPATISRTLLAGFDPAARAVARAAAVLGSESKLADVAALAGLSQGEAGEAADALVQAGVLAPDSPVGFRRPIVRASVYRDLLPHERAVAHARAARLLAGTGRPDRVAAHLLTADPSADPWVIEQLERSGAAALRDGRSDHAFRLFVRALAEPPPEADRPGLLFAAGVAAARSVGSEGAILLAEALELEQDPERRAAIALELAQTLAYGGRAGRAAKLLARTIDELPAAQSSRLDLEAMLLALAATTTSARRVAGGRLAEMGKPGEQGPRSRGLLAALALERATSGGTAEAATSLATEALSRGMLVADVDPGSPLPHLACAALLWADRTDLAEEAAIAALGRARAGASTVGESLARTTRALVRFRRGDLAGAIADAEAALELELSRGEQVFIAPAAATRASVLLERGELARAEEALAPLGSVAHDPDALLAQPLREVRARLATARGDPASALAELTACEARESSWEAIAVVPVAWRSEATIACLALGRPADARRLAAEELSLARDFGAPRAIGVALRAAALAEAGRSRSRSLEFLHDAVAELERSSDRLEQARTSIELGSALRRAGRRSESRDRLTDGLEVARACGATMLVERGYAELEAGGARRRKILRSGVSELTASERRVAAMAADGMTNREIAEALVVTMKTIESHLGHAYRKLEIRSRKELARALAGQPARAI